MLPTIRRNRSAPSLWNLNDDFERFFGTTWGAAPSLSNWSPPVDVAEDDNAFRVTAELPGMNPDDVVVNVENGILSISGEKRDEFEKKDEETGRHIFERRYGSFHRNFSLPRSVDPDKVEAKFENGVLSVTLPKVAAAKPRRIKVAIEK